MSLLKLDPPVKVWWTSSVNTYKRKGVAIGCVHNDGHLPQWLIIDDSGQPVVRRWEEITVDQSCQAEIVRFPKTPDLEPA